MGVVGVATAIGEGNGNDHGPGDDREDEMMGTMKQWGQQNNRDNKTMGTMKQQDNKAMGTTK